MERQIRYNELIFIQHINFYRHRHAIRIKCVSEGSLRGTHTHAVRREHNKKTTANWYLLVYRGVLLSPPTAIPSFSSQQNASTLIYNAMQKPSSKHVMMVGILQLLCFGLTLEKNTHTGNSLQSFEKKVLCSILFLYLLLL